MHWFAKRKKKKCKHLSTQMLNSVLLCAWKTVVGQQQHHHFMHHSSSPIVGLLPLQRERERAVYHVAPTPNANLIELNCACKTCYLCQCVCVSLCVPYLFIFTCPIQVRVSSNVCGAFAAVWHNFSRPAVHFFIHNCQLSSASDLPPRGVKKTNAFPPGWLAYLF